MNGLEVLFGLGIIGLVIFAVWNRTGWVVLGALTLAGCVLYPGHGVGTIFAGLGALFGAIFFAAALVAIIRGCLMVVLGIQKLVRSIGFYGLLAIAVLSLLFYLIRGVL